MVFLSSPAELGKYPVVGCSLGMIGPLELRERGRVDHVDIVMML